MSIEARVAENELMRTALDAARIGLCVIDADGMVIIIGGDVAKKLGTTADAVIGQHYRNLLANGVSLRPGSDIFALDAAETSAEVRMTRADGSVTVLVIQARTAVHDLANRFRVLTVIDLADFGVTRERFLELRRQLDALNSAVLISDARQADYPIVYVNNRFEQMTGYSASYAIGKSTRFLLNGDVSQPGVQKLTEALQRRQSCQVVVTNYRRDGSAFLNEIVVWPLYDESGELTHFMSMQRECNGRVAPIAGKENA
jgi:PAS domain S-box-containing protein